MHLSTKKIVVLLMLVSGTVVSIANQQVFLSVVMLAAVVAVYFFARVKKVFYLLKWISRSITGRIIIDHDEIDALGKLECITLPDGRQLGYYQLGDVTGQPVFYFHGTPSSAGEAMLVPADYYQTHHLHIVVINRPGIGSSTFQPGRQISDFPKDVIELADHLSITNFSVLGYSGGGPYVLSCAAAIPDRLNAAVIVAGAFMMNDVASQAAMKRPVRFFWRVASNFPLLLPFILKLMRTESPPKKPANTAETTPAEEPGSDAPADTTIAEENSVELTAEEPDSDAPADTTITEENNFELLAEEPGNDAPADTTIAEENNLELTAYDEVIAPDDHQTEAPQETEPTTPPDPDKALIKKLELDKLLRPVLNVAVKHPRYAAADVRLTLTGVGQPLSTIAFPVSLFHGVDDKNVPVENARLLAQSLPNATLREYAQEGHLSVLINQFEEIAMGLTGHAQRLEGLDTAEMKPLNREV